MLIRRYDTDPAGSVAGYMAPFPTTPTEWPVLVTQTVDIGHVLYIAFGLGRHYATHHLTHARDLMVRCVDRLLPKRQVKVDAPRHLEVTVWQQETPKRTIIHLANRTPLAHDMPRIHEIVPVNDVVVEFEKPYDSVAITCRRAEAETTSVGGKTRVRIDKLDVYAAIVIEPALQG